MDTFAYVITVTPTGSLLVNETPAAPTDGEQYTGDALLSWALDQVRRQWDTAGRRADGDAVLNVTIDDQRSGGYGRQKTRLRPGQAASIDALRTRTGKNLEHWAPPIPAPDQRAEPTASADTPADDGASLVGLTGDDSDLTPSPIIDQPAIDDPPGLPEQSLHDQLTQSSATADAAKPQRLSRFLAKKESSPSGRSNPKERPAKPSRPKPATRGGKAQKGKQGPAKIGLLSRSPKPKAVATAEPATDSPPHVGWTKYTPRVLRPRLPEAEQAKAKQRQSSSKTIMTVVITFVLAMIVFVAWNRVSGDDQYVAVCVDQRTSARVNTDQPCVKAQAAYFRWWWVPEGSAVPAVGGEVDPQQGSFVAPDPEAPRSYGYANEGGVYTSSS